MVQHGIEYNGVRFLPDRIELIDGGLAVASVKKENVRCISARFTFRAQYPTVYLVAGSLLLLALLWPVFEAAMTLFYRGTFHAGSLAGGFLPAGLGGYLLRRGLARCQLLLVETAHARLKFPFHQKVDRKTLVVFLSQAIRLGYNIDITSVKGMF